MKLITSYLIVFLLVLTGLTILFLGRYLPIWILEYKTIFLCSIAGGYGGVLYCMRGIYLNYSVRDNWDKKWYPWYIIRPIVSMITGFVSYIFLKAGLLVLESQTTDDSTYLGFFALAFVAGLNVDKFIAKIENLAKVTWGIEKSRTSNNNNE
jgi:hypothetical protein